MSFRNSRTVMALAALIGLDLTKPESAAPAQALDEAITEDTAAHVKAGVLPPAPAPTVIAPAVPPAGAPARSFTQDELDAAIAKARDEERTTTAANAAELVAAKAAVAPLVGDVNLDSAEAVYRFALGKSGVENVEGLPAAALAPMLAVVAKAKIAQPAPTANDAAPVTALDAFPGLANFRQY